LFLKIAGNLLDKVSHHTSAGWFSNCNSFYFMHDARRNIPSGHVMGITNYSIFYGQSMQWNVSTREVFNYCE